MTKTNTPARNAAHAANMDAAQRALDARAAQGEDVSCLRIDPKTYEIVGNQPLAAATYEIVGNQPLAAATYEIGDRVSVTLPQTGEVPASGTVQKAANGWFVILLDQPECFPLSKAGIVSARKDRMALLPAGESEQAKGATFADQSAQERSALRAMATQACPECGDDDVEHDRLENGLTVTACNGCGWTSDAGEADEMDEALEEAETAASKMAEALRKARVHYQKTRRPQGAASADCADLIAKELRDYEPLEVAALADRCFDLPKGTHAEKYAHLNNGQIRMNSGNKIRAAWKKGDDAIRARIAFVLGLDQDDDQPDGTDVAEMAANDYTIKMVDSESQQAGDEPGL